VELSKVVSGGRGVMSDIESFEMEQQKLKLKIRCVTSGLL
jgi:hypothetical protein